MSEAKQEIHQSDMVLMEMCGEAFRRKVLEREREWSNARLIGGTATHKGRAKNLTQKIETHEDLPVEEVLETARDSVVEEFKTWEVESEAEPGKVLEGDAKEAACQQVIDHSARLARADYSHHQLKMQPLAVELGIAVELKQFPFNIGMKLDAVESFDVVSDCKTAKRTPPGDVAETSDQLALYSLGYEAKYGHPAKTLRLDYVVPLKKEVKAVSFTTEPSRERQEAMLNRLVMHHEAVKKGVFLPASAFHWKCSPNYCGFYWSCRYIGRSKRPQS